MEKQYKRTSRLVKPEVRAKISQKLKGKRKPETTKTNISKGLKMYWNDDANFPDDVQRHEGTGNGWVESGDIV